jgi:hypothetical protein
MGASEKTEADPYTAGPAGEVSTLTHATAARRTRPSESKAGS